MSKVYSKIKLIFTVFALAVVLMIPFSVSAKDPVKKPRDPKPGYIPEFSADATSGSIALLLGGTLILMGRRRKEKIQEK